VQGGAFQDRLPSASANEVEVNLYPLSDEPAPDPA
jgi:hypothetical protein